jgi:hypothetical protein
MELELEIAKRFVSLMDQDKYTEAGLLMDPICRYKYRGKIIEGVDSIVGIYINNFESVKHQIDEIEYVSEIIPDPGSNSFRLKYLDRLRKNSSWFEHRCEQKIKVVSGKVVEIEHFDLPGEAEKLRDWFARMGIKR